MIGHPLQFGSISVFWVTGSAMDFSDFPRYITIFAILSFPRRRESVATMALTSARC